MKQGGLPCQKMLKNLLIVISKNLRSGLPKEPQTTKFYFMNRLKQFFILSLLLSLTAGVYVWFFVYNKPHRNIENTTPEYTETARSLYTHYHGGHNSNHKNMDGTVVEFTGIPSKIEKNDSLVVLVFSFNRGLFGDEGIRCTMLPNYNQLISHYNFSQSLTIKGFCAGYNDTDVVLEQCSIVSE